MVAAVGWKREAGSDGVAVASFDRGSRLLPA
jgi:hypothetical protein